MTLLTTGEAATIIGLGVQRVRELDAELHPYITPKGVRIYTLENVEKFAAKRRSSLAKKPAKKSA